MKKNILIIIFIILGMIAILSFKDHNFKRTVEACIVAQKQTSKTFDQEESRKYCEKKIEEKVEK